MTLAVPLRRRWVAALSVTALSASSLLSIVPAHAATRATNGTPYVAVKHVAVLKGSLKKTAAASFVLKGLPAAGVTAVVLSVSVTSPGATGALVGYGYGAKRPHVVSLSFSKSHTASGLVVVVPGSKRRGTLYNASAATEHVVATVVGYYAAPGVTMVSTAFVPVPPTSLASLLLKKQASGAFVLLGKGKLPAVAVGALVAVTTSSAGSGTIKLSPYGSKSASTLSLGTGRATTTLLVIRPGSRSRVKVASTAGQAVRVRVDVVGYLKTLYAPGAPTAVTATAGSSSALVSWKAPASDGGAPITSFTVTADPGGVTATAAGTATSVLVRGLTPGTNYTFTVTATNSRGGSPASSATAMVTPYTTPDAPLGGFAFVGGYGQVLVLVLGGSSDGGSPLTAFRVTASPGGAVVTIVPKTSTPTSTIPVLSEFDVATFNGLTPGVSYTFTIVAANAAGDSAVSPPSTAVTAGGVSRASVSNTGAQGDVGSLNNGISADGRYVVFDSGATNLVPGSSGGHQNVFVRDRVAGTTTLVSAANGGGYSDGDSFQPSISADGRYVAFGSNATNLTSTVVGLFQIYVRDLQTNKTKLISASGGTAADRDTLTSVISADGSTIAFVSNADNLLSINTGLHQQVYAANRQSGDLFAVSVGVGSVEANGDSFEPAISGDGSIVAWASKAHNLVTTPTTTHQQVYQRTVTSSTSLTSILSTNGLVFEGNGDAENPSISGDGSYTAFDSLANNLTPETDGNGAPDVFLCYKGCSSPELVDVGAFGATSNRGASLPSLSQNGAIIAYASSSTDLVSGVVPTASVPQIFVNAISSKKTIVATHLLDGTLGNAGSAAPHLTGDAAHVSFVSSASNLVPGDTNSRIDVFVADLPATIVGGLPAY